MIKKHTYKNLTWVDLFRPTQEEIRELMKDYSLIPSIAEDLLTPTFKPSVDLHKDFLYLILHFPALKHTHFNEKDQEVDFIVGRDFIITSRYDTIDSLHKFSKEFDVTSILEKENVDGNAEHIFFLILKKLYNSVNYELESIQDSLETAENMIFKGEERRMVRELSGISRDLLNFKQATNTHKETLESLSSVGSKFFDNDFGEHMKEIVTLHDKIRHHIAMNRESLVELRDTNDSLLSTKQNETMTVLTIMAFVTFPLSLIASIFGMNTETMPLVGQTNDFWMVIGIMLVLTTCMFLLFKYKKWL
ncbi:CorA family divalent cation transporter [Patescibacteria group bacterium]|nr:CorA family divalent cation transporter [Patescibacteria group bacterium]